MTVIYMTTIRNRYTFVEVETELYTRDFATVLHDCSSRSRQWSSSQFVL